VKPIVLRPARPADIPHIQRFHREQNERDETSYPLPKFFLSNGTMSDRIPVVLIGCEEGKDDPVGCIYVERRAELMFAGCDPRLTAFARRDIDGLNHVLSWMGYSGIHCDVPRTLVEHIRKPLMKAGFAQTDDRLAHFYREVIR
jgi:hypothetical protein